MLPRRVGGCRSVSPRDGRVDAGRTGALGSVVGVGHSSLVLSTLAAPAPAVPQTRFTSGPDARAGSQAGSLPARAPSTSPGLGQAAWDRGWPSVHTDTHVHGHAWERECTTSTYVCAHGCFCIRVICGHVHTVQGAGGVRGGALQVECDVCTRVCVLSCACGPR